MRMSDSKPEDLERAALATIEDLFTYHPPSTGQIPRYQAIREAAKAFALAIHKHCPPSADRTYAMRQLQSAVMTANRSIALNGRSYR